MSLAKNNENCTNIFQSSPILASKVGAYPSEAPFRRSTL
jgi:hypothetical protein